MPEIARSAYVHIPFCRRRCYYCDFPITVLGNNSQSLVIEEYVELLCQEITITNGNKQPLKTIFFGGGTPSLLPVEKLAKILDVLDDVFGIAAETEISLEIDPGTFNLQQLRAYQSLGINRISLGVQAFQDQLLKVCGRSHSLEDILAAIELIKQLEWSNFSIDLISGLPHQTLDRWEESLLKAISFSPHHISCYDLVLEPVTAFGKQYQAGKTPLPTDENTANMYRLARQLLTSNGYEHYEISNYARAGYQCRHNRVYWENQNYYGFGMGAASYINNQRFTRPRTRKEYYLWVENLIKTAGVLSEPELSTTDILLETLMLGLRLTEGVNLSTIEAKFGRKIVEKITACLQFYIQQNWVEIIDSGEAKILRLQAPEGFLFSNTILATLFEHLENSIDS